MNLYYNNYLNPKDKKEFKYIKSDGISKYFNTCYLMIKDFWKELYNNKELVYKILKYAKDEELKDSYLNIFFTQNFYINLYSKSNEFPNDLYYIIQKLLNDIFNSIRNIEDYPKSFKNSNISYLLDGMIMNEKMSSFFNLILSDIIEEYENSGESMQILLFNVDEIKEYYRIRQETLMTHNKNNSDIINIRKRQNSILNLIYKMKLPIYNNNDISINESFNNFDYDDEIIDKDYKNNEIFSTNYLPELNKNDIIELLNKEENEIIKSYIRNQLILMENDKSLYSNQKFLDNIQKSSESEKILYFYQKSFMTTINIIRQIFKRLNKYINIIPEEIKIISIIIMKLLKKKYNWINNFSLYKYILDFFMKIFKSFFLSPEYNTLINSVIISKYTKSNLAKIYDIILKLISGNFYKNSKGECDYTPFNLFFLEIIPDVFTFCEKLLETNTNLNLKIYNIEKINSKNINNNINIKENSISIIYNIHQLTTILNIINHNHNSFFLEKILNDNDNDNDNDNNYNYINNNEKDEEFLTIFKKLKENKEIFAKLREKEKNQKKIFYFAYNENTQKLLDIIGKDESKYFKIKELKENSYEEINLNKIIRAKNLIIDLLYISPKLYKLTNLSNNSKEKTTKEILNHLKQYFKGISNYKEDKNILNNNNINNNEQTEIPKEWYIHSLMICLENLDEEHTKNDYEKLYKSIKKDLKDSINKYNFMELTQNLRDLKTITIIKNRYINLQEKYKDIITNTKIRKIIEKEPLKVIIQFIYKNEQKIFNVYNLENINLNNHNFNKKYLIKCSTINDFIKNFPNLELIQQRQDIDIFLIEKEINLLNGLDQYFAILKNLINNKFDKEEKNIVFNKIQKYILIKIYDKIYPKDSDNDDMKVFQQTIILSWVRPHHLKLDNTYIDNSISLITDYINKLDNEKSPNGKFNAINNIFNTINYILSFNSSFSVDEIAPLCEYCLIKAQPERLSSNLRYLQNFISNGGSGLRKMRFDILKTCMNSIKVTDYKKFEGITKEEYNKLCNISRQGK